MDLATLVRIEALYAQLDPVPAGLIDRVQFGITLDALHAEIADLQRSADLVGVRSEDSPDAQTVTFTSARLTTMVTISRISADAVRIDGWAVPGAGVTVDLRTQTGTTSVAADEDGPVRLPNPVERGMAQFGLSGF